MAKEKVENWKMPEWMEEYRHLICNTGGNSIEDLLNDRHTNSFNNSIRAGLIVAAHSQVVLLERLRRNGKLTKSKK